MGATKTDIYNSVRGRIVMNRRMALIILHAIMTVAANFLAFVLRFEAVIPIAELAMFFRFLPLLVFLRLVFYLRARLHKDMWRYSSVPDLAKIIKSATVSSVIFFIIVRYITGVSAYPRSIYFLDWLLLVMFSGGSRLGIRVFREYLQEDLSGRRVLLIGAGDAGEMIVRDMKNNPTYDYKPIGFIDDDPYKKGFTIHGLPIFGPRSMIGGVIEKYRPEEILISMPSIGRNAIQDIYNLCKPFNIPIKTLPGISDILDGRVSVSQIKPLSLEDLLQREPIRTDIEPVREFIQGKTVLVTGAGGSIGAELCRQIMNYGPSQLVMLDRYENGLFQIDLELSSKCAGGVSTAVVGDILDSGRVEEVFVAFRPEVVFHAAAHKHVPLMEGNSAEAVKNNVFGTKCMLDAAVRHGVQSFVTISTDKAVNPTSVMGATKRIGEFLTIGMDRGCQTKFSVVRFGNVLGSNGSVVNVFSEQLKKGGPLTVTHPDIRRYFMLIPEAVQLVLIAASAGSGGEIFVLDMGEQIRIVELAENMIRLSGFVPYEGISIVFTGLRPGEKLYEELFDAGEKVSATCHSKLFLAKPDRTFTMEELEEQLADLESLIRRAEAGAIVSALGKMVPNYGPLPAIGGPRPEN